MKLAVIGSEIIEPIVTKLGLGYHMVLGQELLKSQEYLRWATELCYAGNFVMMDNGAAEGEQPPYDQLCQLAIAIGCDEIVMPDVYRSMEQTKSVFTIEAVGVTPIRMRAICPQGTNWVEWRASLRHMLAVTGGEFATICIPRHFEQILGGRQRALELLDEYGLMRSGRYNIHLLGTYRHPVEECRAIALGPYRDIVRGIDTGAPIAYAQEGRLINDGGSKASLVWDADYALDVATTNVNILLGACHGRS